MIALAGAMRVADGHNMGRILNAFPDIIEKYDGLSQMAKGRDKGPSPRYFTDGRDSWVWDGQTMFIIQENGHHESSIFFNPKEILAVTDVWETTESGERLPESAELEAAP